MARNNCKTKLAVNSSQKEGGSRQEAGREAKNMSGDEYGWFCNDLNVPLQHSDTNRIEKSVQIDNKAGQDVRMGNLGLPAQVQTHLVSCEKPSAQLARAKSLASAKQPRTERYTS